ncbi:alpha/beta hydrolase [Alicyclobacillus sp. SO9]|uniref:alpha/beta hydrolase n=1 Tax=Alicyclobacillus sp. SO9 TaxID=2665646 RepID=UPI0018E85C62|nr:alpha/beta hydrolase [Alicyclobacillus sp. SO9]QQE78335.1 alpha/beta hydrolase [Alicyclobacillus sp. SO9]
MDFIHQFIPASGGNEMTLLLLHGTGGTEEDLLAAGKFLAPSAALLGVRGKVLERGMPRFFRRVAEGVFDEEDLMFRTRELAHFTEEAAKMYKLNPKKIFAVGYSNGANIAASMLLLEPSILSGAVLFRSMVPLEPKPLPDLTGTPILMLSGRQDPIVPVSNSERLAQLFSEIGANVTLNWESTGHGLTRPELEIAKSWIQKLA